MIKVHEIDEQTVLLELQPTKYYHLWNIWDLYEHLYGGQSKMTFEVEDFPMDKEEMLKYAKMLHKDE